MKILIASSVDTDVINHLAIKHEVVYRPGAKPDVLKELIQGCRALVFRSGVDITADLLSRSPRLELLVRAGCGLDNVDLEYIEQHHMQLVRIPGPSAQAVAEMAIALMLGLARRVREADVMLRQGHFAKHELEGHLISGKTLGIVGAGNIGSRVGQLATALGMHCLGCVKNPGPAVAERLFAKGIQLTTFDEVISQADYLTIHVPLNDSTRKLINADALSRTKPGAILTNLARGGVVDEAALHDALVSGQLRGAALDVHEQEGEGKISPLADLNQVLLTPHIGAMTVETQQQIGQRVIEIIESFCRRSEAEAPLQVAALQETVSHHTLTAFTD
jgi:D-3-phosphoglycerate dehydrogenase / 2-oxoglutarate reductase